MILALLVSTGLIVTMSATVEFFQQSIVDIIASDVGRADLTVSKKDTSLDLFMPIESTAALMLAADHRILSVHPRVEILVEIVGSNRSEFFLTGLDSDRDPIGTLEILEGEYLLGDGRVAIDRWMANEFGLSVGDTLNIAYALPIPREPGKDAPSGASSVLFQRQFTVSAIVTSGDVARHQGILAELDDIQSWLIQPEKANQMLVVVNPSIYESSSADATALIMREIADSIQRQLGDSYLYQMEFVKTLVESGAIFLAIKALINTYGLISLGVVGLLVYTLVMTNVQEQRRDMAVLRILGSQQGLLFGLVIIEVIMIGLIGVGLGVILGQVLTTYALVPALKYFLAEEGLALKSDLRVSVSALLPPVISAFVVLVLSSLKPAREASRTKVIHAINPSVADNIQLEDLAQLRERRPDSKMFLVGMLMTFLFVLITSFDALANFGGEVMQIVIVMLGLFGMVLGVSLMFFILTVPFERLILMIMRLLSPRLTFFARRNVSRAKTRNTLISLLVLFSAVLPSFLGSQAQLEMANAETNTKMQSGAPLQIQTYNWSNDSYAFPPNLVRNEFAAKTDIYQLASLTYPYTNAARDHVAFRQASVDIIGVDGDLSKVLYEDLVAFSEGGAESFHTILNEPNTAIISEGLAEYMGVALGDTIELQGEGLDHYEKVRIVGIARRLPGVQGITRSRIAAQNRSTVLVSLPFFSGLVTELNHIPPGPQDPLIVKVMATLQPQADQEALLKTLYNEYRDEYGFRASAVEFEIAESRGDMMFLIIMLLGLTGISFTTAVFAVFAVIYVTVYSRRIEIGMLKSMGMLRRQITGMLTLEAIAMTLGSALAGITAGATMAYVNFFINAVMDQRPVIFTIDKIAMPAIIIMVVLASIFAAALSARRIVRKPAVEILRMS
jgi:ABC-type antimicrobial peptide transport system permease subunit